LFQSFFIGFSFGFLCFLFGFQALFFGFFLLLNIFVDGIFRSFGEIDETYFLLCCNERTYVLKNSKLWNTKENFYRAAYENLKTYTSPISMLNELQRIEFLNCQRELAKKL